MKNIVVCRFALQTCVLITLTILLIGCDDIRQKGTDNIQARQTEQLMSEVQRQIGLPNIVNFQQKKIMKMILEECDKENIVCYAYLKADYTGKLVFIGKCIGYGIPFSAQYTNPEREVYPGGYERGFGSLPQPDPNGLFMPTSSSATWLLMIDSENRPRLVYLEPEIVVSPFMLPIE